MNLINNNAKALPVRKIIRLTNHNYAAIGWYFITVCVANNANYFGKIESKKMNLNQYGKIVEGAWLSIVNRFPHVQLDCFIVMPNHFHGILIIKDEKKCTLSACIRAFKSGSSYQLRKSGLVCFQWQRSFYEHAIRNEEALSYIRTYITNNPLKWELDKYFQKS